MRIIYVFTIIISLGLSGAAFGADLPKLPFLTLPVRTAAPVIDGHISDDEWKVASGVSGLVRYGNDRLSDHKTEVSACYDSSGLYLSWRRYQSRIPKSEATARDGALWADDAVEIFIQPKQGVGPYYQFIGNAAGVFWDSVGIDGKWNGEWKYAASVTTSYWEGELMVPWSTLGVENPSPGTALGFNFCADIQDQPPVSDTMSPIGTSSFHEYSKFGTLVLGRDTLAVKLGNPAVLADSKIGVAADLVNPGDTKKTISSEIRIARGGQMLESSDDAYDIAPNSDLVIDSLKKREHGEYDVKLLLFDNTTGTQQPLAGRSLNLTITKPPVVNVDRTRKTLTADLDIRGLSQVEGAKVYAVLSRNNREVAGQTYTLSAKTDSTQINLGMKRLDSGIYDLQIIIYSGSKRILEHKQAVEW